MNIVVKHILPDFKHSLSGGVIIQMTFKWNDVTIKKLFCFAHL